MFRTFSAVLPSSLVAAVWLFLGVASLAGAGVAPGRGSGEEETESPKMTFISLSAEMGASDP